MRKEMICGGSFGDRKLWQDQEFGSSPCDGVKCMFNHKSGDVHATGRVGYLRKNSVEIPTNSKSLYTLEPKVQKLRRLRITL